MFSRAEVLIFVCLLVLGLEAFGGPKDFADGIVLFESPDSYCTNSALLNGLQSTEPRIIGGGHSIWKPSPSLQDERQVKAYLRRHSDNFGTWGMSAVPLEEVKLAAIFSDEEIKDTSLNTLSKIQEYLKAPDRFGEIEIRSQTGRYTLDEIEAFPVQQAEDIGKGTSGAAMMYLCSLLTYKNVLNCTSGLSQIVAYMSPKVPSISFKAMTFTMIPLYRALFTDETFAEGVRIAALKISDKALKKAMPSSNLFDELYNSFVEAGLSSTVASDHAWDVIGLISTSGANLRKRLFSIKTDSKNANIIRFGLTVISSAIPILDFRTSKTGHIYSYPSTISTTCDIGKPYHFWMTAYLSRLLTKKFGSAEGAAAASFTAQKGYEMLSRTAGRDPSLPFRVDAFYYYNNLLRIDLAFSGAGAWYGAHEGLGHKESFNIDEGIRALVNASKRLQPMGYEESIQLWRGTGKDGFDKWIEIFSPDTSYQFYKKQLKD
jgi:hypothetical protein